MGWVLNLGVHYFENRGKSQSRTADCVPYILQSCQVCVCGCASMSLCVYLLMRPCVCISVSVYAEKMQIKGQSQVFPL